MHRSTPGSPQKQRLGFKCEEKSIVSGLQPAHQPLGQRFCSERAFRTPPMGRNVLPNQLATSSPPHPLNLPASAARAPGPLPHLQPLTPTFQIISLAQSSRFWCPSLFSLLPSLLPDPSPFTSALRGAGGGEKSPRLQMRKMRLKGNKMSPRSQRPDQESNPPSQFQVSVLSRSCAHTSFC